MLRHPAGILILVVAVHAIATVAESMATGVWSVDRIRGWILLPALVGGIAAAAAAGSRRGPLALVAEIWALIAALAAANHLRLVHKWSGDDLTIQQGVSASLALTLVLAAALLWRSRPRAEEGDWHRPLALVGVLFVLAGMRGSPATRRGLGLAAVVFGTGLMMTGLQTAEKAEAFGRRVLDLPADRPIAPPRSGPLGGTGDRTEPSTPSWAVPDASPTPSDASQTPPPDRPVGDEGREDAASPPPSSTEDAERGARAPWILPAPERRLGTGSPRIRAPAVRVRTRIAPGDSDRIGPWAGLLTDRPLASARRVDGEDPLGPARAEVTAVAPARTGTVGTSPDGATASPLDGRAEPGSPDAGAGPPAAPSVQRAAPPRVEPDGPEASGMSPPHAPRPAIEAADADDEPRPGRSRPRVAAPSEPPLGPWSGPPPGPWPYAAPPAPTRARRVAAVETSAGPPESVRRADHAHDGPHRNEAGDEDVDAPPADESRAGRLEAPERQRADGRRASAVAPELPTSPASRGAPATDVARRSAPTARAEEPALTEADATERGPGHAAEPRRRGAGSDELGGTGSTAVRGPTPTATSAPDASSASAPWLAPALTPASASTLDTASAPAPTSTPTSASTLDKASAPAPTSTPAPAPTLEPASTPASATASTRASAPAAPASASRTMASHERSTRTDRDAHRRVADPVGPSAARLGTAGPAAAPAVRRATPAATTPFRGWRAGGEAPAQSPRDAARDRSGRATITADHRPPPAPNASVAADRRPAASAGSGSAVRTGATTAAAAASEAAAEGDPTPDPARAPATTARPHTKADSSTTVFRARGDHGTTPTPGPRASDPRFVLAGDVGRPGPGLGRPDPVVLAGAGVGGVLLVATIVRLAAGGRGGRVAATGTTGSG